MRRHPLIGQRIVAVDPSLEAAGEIIRATHERWDGSGYPDGLPAEQIALPARIIAVCDAYHAMVSGHAHRPARTHAEALAELRRWSGRQFDPALVAIFERLWATPAPSAAGDHSPDQTVAVLTPS